MITDIGKGIIAKYMTGNAPAYASYLALGCGSKPRSLITSLANASSVGTTVTCDSTNGLWVGAQIKITSGTGTLADEGNTLVTAVVSGTDFIVNYAPDVALSGATLSIQPDSDKKALDFEMFRVPITSRGYFTENGQSKIIFTGQLPAEERYEITEIGIFSAGSNAAAGIYDSKTLYAFSENEPWEYHTESTSVAIPSVFSPLDSSNDDIIDVTSPVFQVAANNRTLNNAARLARYERPRFFNNVIMMQGDSADISVSGSNLVLNAGSDHIHLNRPPFDVTRNSPADIMKLAFSVINKDGQAGGDPDAVRIVIDFSTSDVLNGGEYARFEVNLADGTGVGEQDFGTNRYIVAEKQLQQLTKTSGFSWDAVTVAKIYACVIKAGVPSPNYYVALDAFRLDNVNTPNVLYGMTGYSIVQSANQVPIIKRPNTSNYVEFRFAVDVT